MSRMPQLTLYPSCCCVRREVKPRLRSDLLQQVQRGPQLQAVQSALEVHLCSRIVLLRILGREPTNATLSALVGEDLGGLHFSQQDLLLLVISNCKIPQRQGELAPSPNQG